MALDEGFQMLEVGTNIRISAREDVASGCAKNT